LTANLVFQHIVANTCIWIILYQAITEVHIDLYVKNGYVMEVAIAKMMLVVD